MHFSFHLSKTRISALTLLFIGILLSTVSPINSAWAKDVASQRCSSGNCLENNTTPVTSLKCNQFTFDATESFDLDNENLSFQWDFGDGQRSNEAVVNHTYEKSGDYTVTLGVTDNSGVGCSVAHTTQKIRVNIPPFASFDVDDMVCTNEEITIDASKSYDEGSTNLSYFWKLGDGSKVEGNPIITKSYKRGGKYKISLSVDDNSGFVCSSNNVEKTIHVNEPPIAEAGDATIYKCVNNDSEMSVNFDATKSTDGNNDQLTYKWDFGDGTTAEGMRVSHKYNELGNYEAKLLVNDNTNLGCGTAVDFVTVKLNKMPIANAGPDIIACPLEDIDFDGSKSYSFKKGTLSYKWFFGDGQNATGMKTTHAFSKPGNYQTTLTVENELNPVCAPSKDTRLVNINSIPQVTLAKASAICIGNKVEFDASSASDPDGDNLEYYWTFGDGNILKTNSKVTHSYSQGGNYRVSVIVDDGKGSSCSTATAETSIKVNTPPKADAGENLSCCVGLETKFDASGSIDPDGDFLTYAWDFGDGSKAHGAVVTHTYQKSGSFRVVLTIDDNSGTPCSKSVSGFIAEVNTKPVPIINIR